MRYRTALGLCLLFLAWPAGLQAQAQAAAPIDLTGYWVSLVTDNWTYRVITPPKGDYQYLPLNAEARSIADAWDPAKDEAAGEQCKGYGPVGDARDKDLAGRPIDAKASFPGGSEGTGLDGVRAYIRENRQNQFLDGFERKLLVYALNRSLLLSDELVIDRMQAKLAANHYRFSSLVEAIVTSPQFLNQRNSEPNEKTQTAALPKNVNQRKVN